MLGRVLGMSSASQFTFDYDCTPAQKALAGPPAAGAESVGDLIAGVKQRTLAQNAARCAEGTGGHAGYGRGLGGGPHIAGAKATKCCSTNSVLRASQKALVGTPAAGAVSAADLIALAGARAVRITGGPDIDVPIGKRVLCISQEHSFCESTACDGFVLTMVVI